MILWKKGHDRVDPLEIWKKSVLTSILCNKGVWQKSEATFGKKDVHSF